MNRLTKLFAVGAGLAGATYATYVAATWLRYGSPRRARGAAADALLDLFMPDPEVAERHQIAVAAPPEVTLAAAREIELDGSRLVRAIFRARELLLGDHGDATVRPRGLIDAMRSIGWGVLAETPGREIVMGAVTRPWEAHPVFRALPPEEFAGFAEPDYVKIAWTLRVRPQPDGASIFDSETRAVATDPGARSKFRIYWSLLSPGILLIRAMLLPAVEAAAERRWRLARQDGAGRTPQRYPVVA